MNPILKIQNASFSYDSKRKVLDNVTFSIQKGEICTILGPNGSGKSTFLNCLVHLLKLDEGEIFLFGQPIESLSPRAIAQKIAYVSQNTSSVYDYTVRDFIGMGRAPHHRLFERPGAEEWHLVDQAIEKMHIGHIRDKKFTQISGGERQQACVARAIVQQPELIIFDEPTSALDYGNQLRIIALVKEVSEQGYAIIMTTHNPDHAIMLGGQVSVLSRSGEMKTGPAEDMIEEKRLSHMYQTELRLVYVPEIGRIACLPAGLPDK